MAERRQPDGGSGNPQTFGKCTECGHIFVAERTKNGGLYPIGTDGTCSCGNTEFRSPTEE